MKLFLNAMYITTQLSNVWCAMMLLQTFIYLHTLKAKIRLHCFKSVRSQEPSKQYEEYRVIILMKIVHVTTATVHTFRLSFLSSAASV